MTANTFNPMPAANPIKSSRIQISLSHKAQDRFKAIAEANGFNYIPGLITQMLETLSVIDPDRYQEAIVAAKQAGRPPEVIQPRPVGRPPLNKAS